VLRRGITKAAFSTDSRQEILIFAPLFRFSSSFLPFLSFLILFPDSSLFIILYIILLPIDNQTLKKAFGQPAIVAQRIFDRASPKSSLLLPFLLHFLSLVPPATHPTIGVARMPHYFKGMYRH